jgi:integrase/recombinase XerD
MKTTDLAARLETFLREYLPGHRNASSHTVKSYGYAFVLLIGYFREQRHVPADRLDFDHFTPDAITGFLNWLETKRGNGINSRNQRLAAIHSFFRYAQNHHPERMQQCQRILALGEKRRPPRQIVSHLSPERVAEILAGPDLKTAGGRRDAALLSLLYDSGMRVQELCDLTPGDLRLAPPSHVYVLGKGRKRRIVPLLPATAALLRQYISNQGLGTDERRPSPLFFNRQGAALTRAGVRHVLRKYASRVPTDGLARHVSPHTLRHSKAMHLLQAKNPLAAIQSILGHADIQTTLRYAHADLDMMREALARTPAITPKTATAPAWTKPGMLDWLKQLCSER